MLVRMIVYNRPRNQSCAARLDLCLLRPQFSLSYLTTFAPNDH